jgi:hypothetical protein
MPSRHRLLGLLGLLAGLSFLAHIAVVFSLPSPSPLHELEAYNAHTATYAALFLTVVAFAAFALPFIGGLAPLALPAQ